ncbi:hypothetical protein XELAEV_18036224mg [Xenopus laevis]|uniref:Uncharacterized protein n=1 Tax=Xenopus laevis TaxID=8355 RepID=A0A974CH14_XENLA|nr:hypothetical protein XELAEV_18036224mg [Xenopus laevis]
MPPSPSCPHYLPLAPSFPPIPSLLSFSLLYDPSKSLPFSFLPRFLAQLITHQLFLMDSTLCVHPLYQPYASLQPHPVCIQCMLMGS